MAQGEGCTQLGDAMWRTAQRIKAAPTDRRAYTKLCETLTTIFDETVAQSIRDGNGPLLRSCGFPATADALGMD